MFNVEQFIYTTATIENKKGYQIVAKSEGITNEIVTELGAYVYPINVDPSKFNESRSFLLLNNDLAAYSIIKNIGTGYDGRENTLYNHTFIFSKKDFEKYDWDSRFLDKFYIEDKGARGILPTLSITPSPQPVSLISEISEATLERIFRYFFTKKKIALLMDEIMLPQEIISMLPKSMRYISFSTFVIEPKKQPKYEFILNSKLKESKLGKKFEIISSNESTIESKMPFEQSVKYYVQIIKDEKYDILKEIQEEFEKISGDDFKSKLVLASNYIRFQKSSDEIEREQYAEIILEIIKQFDQDIFSFYFEKINSSLKKYRNIKNKISPEINPAMSFFETMFFLPTKMMADVWNMFIDQPSKEK